VTGESKLAITIGGGTVIVLTLLGVSEPVCNQAETHLNSPPLRKYIRLHSKYNNDAYFSSTERT
jgi:hypothetical protein